MEFGILNNGNTGRQPSFRSALRIDGESDNKDYSEIEMNRKKLEEEQQKAAEAFRKKQQQLQEKREREAEKSMLEKQLENSDKEADAMADSIETFSKCMKIASRIAKGDIVPPKDLKYLAEHEPDLYKQAIIMRVPNDKPKKHKSIVDDEDERTDDTGSGGSDSSVSGDEAVSGTEAAAPAPAESDSAE